MRVEQDPDGRRSARALRCAPQRGSSGFSIAVGSRAAHPTVMPKPKPPRTTHMTARVRRAVQHYTEELGPGFVTGAADDDPSGIATYSQSGAQFGYGLLWTMLLTYPLMAAVQLIIAHIGRVTGAGLAKNFTRFFPKPLVTLLTAVLLGPNFFNV